MGDVDIVAPTRRAFVGMSGGLFAAAAASTLAGAASAAPHPVVSSVPGTESGTHHRTITLDGLEIFYREAGAENAPVILLLHGFPTSSRMFRNLIPILAKRFRVIAPDYPGFGHSAAPSRAAFTYTHEQISRTMDALLVRLEIRTFAMYLMDFGGPIGYRLMLKYPDRVTGVVVQNTPVFGEPTEGRAWATLLNYWKDGSAAHRDNARGNISPTAVRNQYITGTRDPSMIDPDNWTIDSALIARPGVDEIMLDLLYDIRNNRQTVAEARRFFGANQRKIMIATGLNDELFPGHSMQPPADMPNIAFHGIDSGHFALEDHCAEIGGLTMSFLTRGSFD